jgi:hypothetical protein
VELVVIYELSLLIRHEHHLVHPADQIACRPVCRGGRTLDSNPECHLDPIWQMTANAMGKPVEGRM